MNTICSFVCIILLTALPKLIRAQPDTTRLPIKLEAGSIELNFSGSLLEIEGIYRTDAVARSGIFFGVPAGLGGIELELGYSHINSLDVLDIQMFVSWQRAFWESPVYPFIALGGGFRQEWLGSFDQVRYPIGLSTGFRVLLSRQVALRADLKLRRVLNDPIRNFTERQLLFGVSILLRNAQ